MPLAIRPLTPSDHPTWERLWNGYLAFYEASLAADAKATAWRRLLDPAEPMHGLLAEEEGRALGLVHFIFHRSTWTPGDYCYLQDLFTAPEARRKGVGAALIEAVCARAKAAGASRVYWLTHETNETARALYDSVATRTGFIQYRRLL